MSRDPSAPVPNRPRRRAPLAAADPTPSGGVGLGGITGRAGQELPPLRAVAAVAGSALALTSTGDPLVAAVVLGVAAGSAVTGVTLVLVAAAVTARWGAPDLGAIAGGQTVLGPAGLLEPPRAATAAWLAAAAIVVSWPGRVPPLVPPGRRDGAGPSAPPWWPGPVGADLVGAVAAGALAAAVVWGPDAQGSVPARSVATILGTAAAIGVATVRGSAGVDRIASALGVVLGAGALALVLADADPVRPVLDAARVAPPLVAAAAATVLAVVGLAWRGRPSRVVAHPLAVVALWAAAARLGADLVPVSSLPLPPTAGLPEAGWLLAAAAVLGLLAGWRWALLGALPGGAGVVHALLAGSAPAGVSLALAGMLAVTVAALVVRAAEVGAEPAAVPVPSPVAHLGRAAAAALALVPVPVTDGWPGAVGLTPWSRGAAVAMAVTLATACWAMVSARWGVGPPAGRGTGRGGPGRDHRYDRPAPQRATAGPGALPPASTP